jgi:predicted heme/steroid binding protein
MTKEELAQNDGKDGRNAYVAINDIIYDVSDIPQWQNGDHQEGLRAGRDLTKKLRNAKHAPSVLEKLPVVGYLDNAPYMSPQTEKKSNQLMFFFFLIIAATGAYFLLP